MKENLSRVLLVLGDMLSVYVSVLLAFMIRVSFEDEFNSGVIGELQDYVGSFYIYMVVVLVLYSEKIYKYRYDFWEETRLVFRGVLISLVIVLSMLALSKSIGNYSRFVIILSFGLMLIIIPLLKSFLKRRMFTLGLWKRRAEICGNDAYVKEEIFANPYLGYVHSNQTDAETVFIDTKGISADELEERLDVSMKEKREVLFIPFLQTYNFANGRIIELSNARKNLIVLENSLLKKSNILIKKVTDFILSILLFPFLIILFLVVIILMKKEEPKGSIFFKQSRMGHNGKPFVCYKFRSMYENGDEILEEYLKKHPHEIICYDEFHKYKNDPRITQIGSFLRRTSLDELPQIINVLKGEMSLIGPRPYMFDEEEKIGDMAGLMQAVKPGITGLWQVSGRSEIDFYSRVEIDVWYTRNWNLWLDLVILVKTVKVVLLRRGAS